MPRQDINKLHGFQDTTLLLGHSYHPMLEAIHDCMEGKKKAGALLQVIEDGTGEFFNKSAEVKYTKTSFYLELDIHFDKENNLYIGTRTDTVRVT